MGGAGNVVRTLASQDWEKTVYWAAMEAELAQVPRRKLPEWAKMILLGIAGGTFWGLLLGLGLAGVI